MPKLRLFHAALSKAVPRIAESVIPSNASGESEPTRKESKDMSGETSGERPGRPASVAKTPESPLPTPAAATPSVSRTSVEVKDTTKGPMESKDGKKGRAVTPKKDAAAGKEVRAAPRLRCCGDSALCGDLCVAAIVLRASVVCAIALTFCV